MFSDVEIMLLEITFCTVAFGICLYYFCNKDA